MTIAMRIAFSGKCADAISFYCDVFDIEAKNVSTFGEQQEILGDVPESKANLIYNAELYLPGSPGLQLHFNDTPALLFQDNLDIVIQQPDIEVDETDPNVIRNLYDKLMHGGKANKVLAETPQYLLYGSINLLVISYVTVLA